ncbi:MAG TPA: hypothetical protein VK911_04470 [Vicinamibacterales bacterium]|nr:hypothetical protein [Vicinamibacterales bacterium]
MNWPSVLLWGFAATIALTTTMAASQGLGLTRMSIPFMLGTMMTARRDRAMVLGSLLHVLNGWGFALVYAAAFESWDRATWWGGAGIGAVHAAFVLTVGMALLPGLHPHMASEHGPPAPGGQLQPPGFLALNYGERTPLVTLVAHLLYGGLLGAFYQLRG